MEMLNIVRNCQKHFRGAETFQNSKISKKTISNNIEFCEKFENINEEKYIRILNFGRPV